MSANFNNPTLTSNYTDVLAQLKERDTDLAVGLDPALVTPTNVPTNAIRWNSASGKWQKYNGSTWADLAALYAISISGNAATASAVAWTGITGKPTTRDGFGITDVPKTDGTGATGTWTIGISGNAGTVTNGLYSTGSYANPTWLTSLAGSKVSGDIAGNAANVTGTVALTNGGTGATSAAAALVNLGERTSATGAVKTPTGTTAQRDGTPAAGYFRFNTSLSQFEGYNGTAWGSIGGGAKGGGSDDIFYENGQTVTTDYTITSGKNAMSAGPVTVANGITVTVPTGSVWTIV